MYTKGSKLEKNFSQLSSSLRELSYLLSSTNISKAITSQIPFIPPGEESLLRDHIKVQESTGRRAIKIAKEIYNDLYIDERYSQKSSRRTAGVLFIQPSLNSSSHEIKSLIETINNTKQEIKGFVTNNYSTQKERFEALKEACPGVMTLHLYRAIRILANKDVQSIRFTWQRKEVLTKPSKNKLLEQLHSEAAHSDPNNEESYQQLAKLIANTPEELLRERRQVREQPSANIVMASKARTVTAPLPIVVIQEEPFTIKALGDFEASERKQRSDRRETTLLGYLRGSAIEAVI